VLVLLVTAYGVGAAAAGLLQARRLLERRRSCEVSALFFAIYAGGYALWLAYGVSIGSRPLVIVDATGVFCATLTLAIALSLRGSLLHPASWKNCPTSRIERQAGMRLGLTWVRRKWFPEGSRKPASIP
jgi:hypothetical protein